MIKKIKESLGNNPPSREAEYKIYEKVSRDISQGERNEGVWTLAFAKSEGNNQKAEALYIELMVQRYKDQNEENIKIEKLDREAKEAKAAEEETKKRNKDRKIRQRKSLERLAINTERDTSQVKRFNQDVIFALLIFGFLVLVLFAFNGFLYSSLSSSDDSDILEELTETEYTSVHNETYWFVEEEFFNEDFYSGHVRSNLIWGDRMSVLVEKSNCGLEKPQIFFQLSTNKVKKDYPNFDFSSLEGKFIRLNLDFDGKYLEKNTAKVINAFELNNGHHAVTLQLNNIYDSFLAIDQKYDTLTGWQFLTIDIAENSPYRKYFFFPERQYRMLGFTGVMVNLIEQCKQDVRAK